MVNDCDTCKHNDKNWDDLPCDGCCTAHSGYEADAISRQDVLDLAKQGILVSNGNYKAVCKAINDLPPVNPQPCQEKWIDEDDNRYICKECEYAHKPQKDPYVSSKYGTATKTGHWIEHEEQCHVEKTYYCSECDCEAWGEYELTNYCPNCGARMVDPQERSDKG